MEQLSIFRSLLITISCLQICYGAAVDRTEGEDFEIKFLKRYHYLSPLEDGNHNVEDALREFQGQSEIPVTGFLDAATIKEMNKPRCGVPDRDEEEFSKSGRVKRFSVSGDKWKKRELTYKFTNYASNGHLTRDQQRSIVTRAFKAWEAISPLNFTDVTDDTAVVSSDIILAFFAGHHSPCSYDFDGPGSALSHAFFPEDGDVHFDDDEVWTDGVSAGTNLFSVALHEIGHLLGLRHSRHQYAIMHETYKPYDPQMKLTDEEKHGIDYIYSGGTVRPYTTPKSQGQCIDKNLSCGKYKNQCTDPFARAMMTLNCPQTCGLCVAASCTDTSPKMVCSIFQSSNLCANNIVQSQCKNTCNVNNCASG